ncbi:MAG: addiction module toxin RelE [Hydrogenophilales bacterium CG03_land_8_20_14_0_80_62_28]|nr:type II toxin-antitoxin system RelE/ParE family toxin [Betaproteobacteria bacterium]OIO77149.1 MAG: addiction module toxin RelE [Hydrogenophilaceae bacterium CG1_02_62_390]PIV22534.1 MAG: addiction module toxin RelE [Hydrogenophilales bacterium CG03_land_8_20_14_0_80_62_28]PIW38305.1 MAG: addiction module toxin RelE [Hydrogenophilales bacterium CG15_BIG_FIL_POST_REV_8_21_14_020_62_31]PIW72174.1 MAG: addiction module toxin RelE [Hydrogenophilales bacterium CG12_big_fil_rev_8_21_14_0_65_61_21]
MTRLVIAPRALLDMERLTDFLQDDDADTARETIPTLLRGLSILKEHPLIGRKAEAGLRELVIARGRAGYLALYDFDVANDTAIVQTIRHQREGGYAQE